MSTRQVGWALGAGASVVLTGWLASAMPYKPAGAWAAVTLSPGWLVYTVLSEHPTSEPLGWIGRAAVSFGSWIFWALVTWGVIRLASRPRSPSTFRSLIAFLPLAAGVAHGQAHPPPTVHELGRGIYLFRTEPYSDVGLDGNVVAVVGARAVLVFDANGTPAAAESVLVALRRLTPLPVRYLVLSHWHWDHWYGAEAYARAFPGLEIIAHERTRALMDGPAVAFNQPGLDMQLPAHIAEVERRLTERMQQGDSGADRLARHLRADQAFLAQKRAVHHTLPNRTVRDSTDLDLGGRVVQVRHADRAITPGDLFLHLPAEGAIILGDVLINPITFALFCYPSGWMRTLDAIAVLDARLLIPGHGDVMQDATILSATRSLLRREYDLARALRARAVAAAAAQDSVLADQEVRRLRDVLTGGDTSRNDAFALYLVEWYVRRVYQELDGTLDDTIPRIP